MNQNESLDTLIELHLDGQLTADQSGRLADLLKDSDEAANRFWRAVHLHHAVVELADQQWGQISIADDSDASESIFPPPSPLKNRPMRTTQKSASKRSRRASATCSIKPYASTVLPSRPQRSSPSPGAHCCS